VRDLRHGRQGTTGVKGRARPCGAGGKSEGSAGEHPWMQLCAASPLGRLPSPLRLAAALSSIDNRLNCAHILASQDPTIIDAVVSDHRNVTAMIG